MSITEECVYKGVRITLRERQVPVPLENLGTFFFNEQRCFIGEEDVTQNLRDGGVPEWGWIEWAKNRLDLETETEKDHGTHH